MQLTHLEMIDAVLGGLLAAWDDENGLLILTSDHGNIEEKDQRQHTRNPVPTLLIGPDHAHACQLTFMIYATLPKLPAPSWVYLLPAIV